MGTPSTASASSTSRWCGVSRAIAATMSASSSRVSVPAAGPCVTVGEPLERLGRARRELAVAPGVAADGDARRVDRELVGPRREAAAALEALEPRHHREQRVVGGLVGDVVELGVLRDPERRGAPPNLVGTRAQQQAVQLPHGMVVLRAGRGEWAEPHPLVVERRAGCRRLDGRRNVRGAAWDRPRARSCAQRLVARRDAQRRRNRAAVVQQSEQAVQVVLVARSNRPRELLGKAGRAQQRAAPRDVARGAAHGGVQRGHVVTP